MRTEQEILDRIKQLEEDQEDLNSGPPYKMLNPMTDSHEPAAEHEVRGVAVSFLRWVLSKPEGKMSAVDRTALVDALMEHFAEFAWTDVDDSMEDYFEVTRVGCRGMDNLPDEEVLDEAEAEYVTDGQPNPTILEDLRPSGDVKLRIWAKYRHPELLCTACAGSGVLQDDECPRCSGSGAEPRTLPDGQGET